MSGRNPVALYRIAAGDALRSLEKTCSDAGRNMDGGPQWGAAIFAWTDPDLGQMQRPGRKSRAAASRAGPPKVSLGSLPDTCIGTAKVNGVNEHPTDIQPDDVRAFEGSFP